MIFASRAVHLRDERRRHLRADLADTDAVVLQVEQQVAAALELAGLRLLDRVVDADVDPLEGARQDVLREVVLVDVHADAPDSRRSPPRPARRDRSRRRPGTRPASPGRSGSAATALHLSCATKSCE